MAPMDSIHDYAPSLDILKASPPVGLTGLTLFGHAPADWLVILTILYTSALFFVLIRDKFIGHYFKKEINESVEIKEEDDKC